MTIKDIANIAGVSISTVSKIVNNKDQGINENTRNHVLKIVKEYVILRKLGVIQA